MKASEQIPTRPTRLVWLLKGVGIFLLVSVVLTITFAVAHLAIRQLYQRIGLTPTPMISQVIGSLAGLLFLALLGTTMATIFRSNAWAPQMNMFAPLLRAMEQIARGNFSVRVESPIARYQNEPLQQLFTGINNMAQQLKQMEAMRQEFISNVSHEIQSPLTSIRGFARALQNEELTRETRQHYLDIIADESMRLSKLSDNLLALAALDAETMQPDHKPYRLDKQIQRLILACEPQWTAKQIDMNVAVDEVLIVGDEDLLSQVWSNLLHNSIKFMPSGGSILVALQPRADQVEFQITDSGIGIASEDQARLFDRFFKADQSRNRALGGSGLGLSIAKKIVDMHQGTIRVASTLGVGTTFTVTLPLR